MALRATLCADCQYFATGETTRFGKGFIKMRKGEVLCSPDDQQLITTILTQLSIPHDTIFDDCVDKVDW